MSFAVSETGESFTAEHRPIVIITSNNEKELPDAFLRRCVFHYIAFPDKETMTDIVRVHHPDVEEELLHHSLWVGQGLSQRAQLDVLADVAICRKCANGPRPAS